MATPDRLHGVYSDDETMSLEARSQRALYTLRDMLPHVHAHSQEFRQRMERAGLEISEIKEWDDWSRIPVFHKKDLIEFQQAHGLEAMLTDAPGMLSRIYMSPGPIFDPEGRARDYWGWTEAFHAAGFRQGDLVQMTFSYHMTPAGLMLEEPLRELGCAVIPAGPGNTQGQLDFLCRLPVTGFVGMASYLKVIKDKAGQIGCRDKLKLDVAFVAAERLSESLRSELEEELSMRVRQGYGTADVGCAAYECQELTGMHLSSRCHVEICDPLTGVPLPPGNVGEVVITPFTQSYPLIRLGTGDLSVIVDDPCPCGRTSPRLAGIRGRVDDTAKVKGQFIYPHQVAEAAKEFAAIKRWQVIVDNPAGKDTLAVQVVAEEGFDKEAFAAAFQAHLKLMPKVQVVSEDDLPEGEAPLVDNRSFDG